MQLTEKQKSEGWRIVKFGDVARECKEKVDRDNNPFERYIAGGDLDSENLRISRWGIFGEHYVGPAFHRIFRKGQILYGSRRTYLKKVAIADFDGVTANTTFVIEPKEDSFLVPGLLPYIMLSEYFTKHSVASSKGSTNPYIVWSDIAKYEFPLPPRPRQEEMLEVYFRIENSLSKNRLSQETTLQAKNILFHDFASKSSGDKTVALGDCLLRTPEYGANTPAIELSKDTYRYIRVTDINSDGSLDQSVAAGAVRRKNDKYLLDTDDILIARTGATVGKPFLYNFERHGEAIFAGYLLRLKFDHSKMLPQYFKHYTDTKRYWHWVEINARGAAQPNINAKQLEKIELMDLSVDDQLSICKSLDAFYKQYEELKDAEAKIINLRKNFTNQYLNGGQHERI